MLTCFRKSLSRDKTSSSITSPAATAIWIRALQSPLLTVSGQPWWQWKYLGKDFSLLK